MARDYRLRDRHADYKWGLDKMWGFDGKIHRRLRQYKNVFYSKRVEKYIWNFKLVI